MSQKLVDLWVCCSDAFTACMLDAYQVSYLVVGVRGFSCRFNAYFSLEEIIELQKKLKNSKLCLFLNNIYSEFEIEALETLLQKIAQSPIRYVMFADFAIAQIVYEANLRLYLFYNPETLVTNYGQFPFYLANNIQAVNLATELTLLELTKICAHKQNMYVTIKAFGLGFVMFSRWPMVSNFAHYAQIQPKSFQNIPYLLIKENERSLANVLYEDQYGTHMLTGYYICNISQINICKSLFDGLLIDGLFVDNKSLIAVVKYYQTSLKSDLTQTVLAQIYEQIQKQLPLLISPGFFGKHSDVLHTKKNEK